MKKTAEKTNDTKNNKEQQDIKILKIAKKEAIQKNKDKMRKKKSEKSKSENLETSFTPVSKKDDSTYEKIKQVKKTWREVKSYIKDLGVDLDKVSAKQLISVIGKNIKNGKFSNKTLKGLIPIIMAAAPGLSASAQKNAGEGGEMIAGVMKMDVTKMLPKADDWFGIISYNLKDKDSGYSELFEAVLEADARKDASFYMDEYVAQMNATVDTLRMYKRGTFNHNQYRKRIFRVATGKEGLDAYCLATIVKSFTELSERYSVFKPLTAAGSNRQHNGAKCSSFVSFIKRRFPNCVVETNDVQAELLKKDARGKMKYRSGTLFWESYAGHSHIMSMVDNSDGRVLYDAGNMDRDDATYSGHRHGFVIDFEKVLTAIVMDENRKRIAGMIGGKEQFLAEFCMMNPAEFDAISTEINSNRLLKYPELGEIDVAPVFAAAKSQVHSVNTPINRYVQRGGRGS